LEITEPEKLIPPDGSYAISVNQEQSHAMAIILRDKDGRTKVFLLCLDPNCKIRPNSINTISFHKKISENYNFNKTEIFIKQISKDIVSINELIF
jgi:FAD synthase